MAEMIDVLRKKSPRAPTMALDEALEKVGKIYDMDRVHPTSLDVAARHMGFKSANSGSVLSAVASMRYYGLLERPRDGMVAVSKDFEAYRYAPTESLRSSFLLRFLTTPPLFAELIDRFSGKLPSDDAMIYELIQRAFIPGTAASVVNVFRRSYEFVEAQTPVQGNAPQHPGEESEIAPHSASYQSAKAAPRSESAPSSLPTSGTATSSNPVNEIGDSDRIPVRLTGGRRAWLIIPQVFLQADKDRLKAQIDLLITNDDD